MRGHTQWGGGVSARTCAELGRAGCSGGAHTTAASPASSPDISANARVPFISLLFCVAHMCVYCECSHTCACALTAKTYPL